MPETSPTITALLKDIATQTKNLNGEVEKLVQAVTRSRTFALVLAFTLGLNIVVTVALGFTIQRVMENSDDIRAVQSRISAESLCPMYQLFLNGLHQPKQPYETDREYTDRQRALPVLSDAYDALECQNVER